MKSYLLITIGLILASACGPLDPVLADIELDQAVPEADVHEDATTRLPEIAEDVPGDAVDASEDLTIFDMQSDEVMPGCEPGAGCFLDECLENSECQSGWCVEHVGEGVCTQECSEECPPGWTCKQVGASDPDLVFVCVSSFSNLCKPCATSDGCKAVGGAQDVCVDYQDEGSFCGGACQEDEDCPWGFSCSDVLTIDGIETRQCIADAGSCPCTQKSAELLLWTLCDRANEFGLCDGKRICTEEGLSDCDAAMPDKETCNGLDDDCDSDIDEPDDVDGKYVSLCDDGNDCTEDKCLGEAGCEHTILNQGECLDGDPCTVADHCQAGICTGNPVLCDDSNPCTDDSCDGAGGCQFVNNSESCDDSDPCTVADQCEDGICAGTSIPCDCTSDADCAEFEDEDLCNGILYCDLDNWPYKCVVDESTVVVCPEPVPGIDAICQQAACNAATGDCSLVPDHEGIACDDGDLCSLGDACAAGLCVPGVQVVCNDSNPCTDDSCQPDSGCQFVPNLEVCDDGNACTGTDLCTNGTCLGGTPLECDDLNLCTTDSCDPVQGCVHVFNSVPCEDGDACTAGDTCAGGVCSSGKAVVCNDNNLCTDDSCTMAGDCQFLPNQESCDDGNFCTLVDGCAEGACVGTQGPDCNDDNLCTTDVCDPGQGCVHQLNESPCDDGNLCTSGDHCHLGGCLGGLQISCNDSNVCTDDICSPDTGCVFTPNSDGCDDGNACTIGDNCLAGSCKPNEMMLCNDDHVCTDDSCNPDSGCVYENNAAPCNDFDKCTTDDICDSGICGGESVVCNDSNSCTDDSCESLQGCVFKHNEAQCNDGNACTEGDQCGNGLCLGATPTNCDDNSPCTIDSCLPLSGCKNQVVTPCCGDDICDDAEGCDCPQDCAVAEVCDGVDNNCDDEVDNGLGATTCGVGVCEHVQENCVDGLPVDCDPLAGKIAEVCGNNQDDDCDGGTDEEDECPVGDVPCAVGTNVLQNPGFETGSTAPWVFGSGYNVVPEPHDGSFSVKSVGNVYIEQTFSAVPTSQINEVSFWTKKGAGGMPMSCEFTYSDGSKSSKSASAGTSWEFENITSGLSGGKSLVKLKMWGYSGGGGNQSWIDSVKICRQ
jgi:hypothetical protein